MQIFDSSLFVWVGIMVLILLLFMMFSTWQVMRNRKDEIKGLDLESYHKIEERKRKLAIVRYKQAKELDEDQDDFVLVPGFRQK